jgi:hypothetical protein
MGFIILLIVLIVLSIIIIIISNNKNLDLLNFVGVVVVSISTMALIIMLLILPTMKSDFEQYKNEYQTTKMLIDSYKGEEYGNINALTEKIIYVNDKIASHKAGSKNFWINIWYSEEVGNLEPITFK